MCLFLTSALGVIIVAVAFMAAEANAQDQSVTDLFERLKQKGVPVKTVTIVSQIPFQVDVVVQSSTDGKKLTLDDLWDMQLTRREATLAYRIGMRVNNYTLIVLNTKGETIAWEQNYLRPSALSQQAATPVVPRVDNATAQRLVAERLNLAGMSLTMLRVISDTTSNTAGQILVLELVVPDLEAANRSLLPFMDSLSRTLATINSEQGTNLVLCRLKLTDRQGTVLLNYVRDLETHEETSSSVEGLVKWYPHPPEELPGSTSPMPTPISPLATPAAQPSQ